MLLMTVETEPLNPPVVSRKKQLFLEDRVLMSELRTTKSGSRELRTNERSRVDRRGE